MDSAVIMVIIQRDASESVSGSIRRETLHLQRKACQSLLPQDVC